MNKFLEVNHQDNCLILANELRISLGFVSLPLELMCKSLEFDAGNLVFTQQLLDIYADKTQQLDEGDIVLMLFNKITCLGIYFDGSIFYLGNSGIAYRELSNLSKYILSFWKPKT